MVKRSSETSGNFLRVVSFMWILRKYFDYFGLNQWFLVFFFAANTSIFAMYVSFRKNNDVCVTRLGRRTAK